VGQGEYGACYAYVGTVLALVAAAHDIDPVHHHEAMTPIDWAVWVSAAAAGIAVALLVVVVLVLPGIARRRFQRRLEKDVLGGRLDLKADGRSPADNLVAKLRAEGTTYVYLTQVVVAPTPAADGPEAARADAAMAEAQEAALEAAEAAAAAVGAAAMPPLEAFDDPPDPPAQRAENAAELARRAGRDAQHAANLARSHADRAADAADRAAAANLRATGSGPRLVLTPTGERLARRLRDLAP